MAGVTDSAFRQLCRENGADVVYTEMTSIDALAYGSKKTMEMLKFSAKEKPVVIQLFGKRPEHATKAVQMVQEAGFSGVDLNFGCPAKKVIAHGGGVSLLKDLNLCHELVHAVCEASRIPVSVKTRISINKGRTKVTVFEFIDKIKDLPVSALMLHGRSYEQGFSGEVDYEVIKQVKKRFKGIVLGNGGLNTPEDVEIMMNKTGVQGAGIARGVYGKPWIFNQIKQYLFESKYEQADFELIKKIALRHAKLNFKAKNKHGIVELRKHLCWYFRGFPKAAEIRKHLVRVETLDDVKAVLSNNKWQI